MGESIIGTVLLAASMKRTYTVYHLIFTDSRVLAIEANVGGAPGTQQTPSPFGNNQLMGMLAGAAMGGMMGGSRGGTNMAQRERQMANMQAMQQWQRVKEAAQGKPIVDYSQTQVTDDMAALGHISIPYDKVKEITIKKEFGQPDYVINFGEGLLSGEKFAIQPDAGDNVIELVKKTPLGAKLKK